MISYVLRASYFSIIAMYQVLFIVDILKTYFLKCSIRFFHSLAWRDIFKTSCFSLGCVFGVMGHPWDVLKTRGSMCVVAEDDSIVEDGSIAF